MLQPTAFDKPPPPPKAPLWKPVIVVVSVMLAVLLLVVAFPYSARMMAIPPGMRPFLGYRSEEEAREAIRQNPSDAPAHMTIAKAAQMRHDNTVALQEWREAARIDSNNSNYQMSLAFELINQRKYDEARPILEAVAKKKDSSATHAAHLLNTLSYYKAKLAKLAKPASPTGK